MIHCDLSLAHLSESWSVSECGLTGTIPSDLGQMRNMGMLSLPCFDLVSDESCIGTVLISAIDP